MDKSTKIMDMDALLTQKPVTFESLALIVREGFKEVGVRMTDMEDRLSSKINSQIQTVDDRINLLDKTLSAQIEKVDQKCNGIQSQLDNIYLNYTMRRKPSRR